MEFIKQPTDKTDHRSNENKQRIMDVLFGITIKKKV